MTKERPILFSGEMVKAILAGRKTQTRRVIKPQPTIRDGFIYGMQSGGSVEYFQRAPWHFASPHYKVGQRLWVKETFQIVPTGHSGTMPIYRADGEIDRIVPGKWKPSIFMPRIRSRITLEITDVRVERLNAISEEDAKAEGCCGVTSTCFGVPNYRYVWESINGPGSWAKNPWVWCITFRHIETPGEGVKG